MTELMMTEGAPYPKSIVFQVVETRKPLLSVARVADMGFEVQYLWHPLSCYYHDT